VSIPEWAGTAAPADPFGEGVTAGFAAYNPFADDPLPYVAPAADPVATDFGMDPMASPFDDPVPYAEPNNTPAPVADQPTDKYYNAIAPILDEFVSEVRRSIDYYRSRGGEIDAVELCGGGAKLGGLAPFLSKSLGIECDAYDPLRRLNVNAKKVPPAFVEEHKQAFAVAVGNGLHIFFD